MIVGIVNFSGNVGKSTLGRHLLQPRIPGAELYSVESINSGDAEEAERLRGKQFGDLMSKLLLAESAIVDIGSSNVEEIVNRMAQFQGSHENFDYFVVPTVPDGKQLRDTLATIETLAELGVPAKKIQVVMNKVEIDSDPQAVFAPLFKASADAKSFVINPGAVVHQNELYEFLKEGSLTVSDLTKRSPGELKKALKGIKDEGERHQLARQITACYLAQGVKRELDEVFSAIFG